MKISFTSNSKYSPCLFLLKTMLSWKILSTIYDWEAELCFVDKVSSKIPVLYRKTLSQKELRKNKQEKEKKKKIASTG